MTDTLTAFDPTDSRAFRNALGKFATGVTVVTTQTDNGPVGMTVNSFSSVSLDPPLVLWSAEADAARHDTFAKAAHYCIHVLAADQTELALHFAKFGAGFEGLDWHSGPGGAPELPQSLAHFHCQHFAAHPAGDHTIIIGQVTHAAHRPGAGLIFDQGRFGHLAET